MKKLRPRRALAIVGSWLFFSTLLVATTEKPNFQDDIYPLFDQSCNSCHNPDKARGGLDLTSMSAILAGGSSGDSVLPGEGANSYLYKLVAHLEKPYMPAEKEKLPANEIALIKKWIDQGLLPTATGKAMKKKKSSLNLAFSGGPTGKPDGPPPMPLQLSLEPSVWTAKPAALSAMATNPWSPLAAISGQKQVLLYHTDTREILGVLPYPEGFVESLVFSRNGLLLLAGGGRGGKSGRIAAWNVKTGRRILSMGQEFDTVLACDISSDQSLVALGGPAKRVKVYDLASGEILHNIKKHSEWVTAVAFSPDGVLLATGDRNGGLHVWEARSGNLFYTLNGHKQAITCISWRGDSNVLASSSEEGSVRVWEMFNGKQVRALGGHGGGSLSVDMDKKGNLVTAGRDKTVKIWNSAGTATRTISGFPEMVMEARFNHDGSQVIAGDWSGAVGIWNVADGKKVGDILANPPSLVMRLTAAEELVAKREPIAAKAKAAHTPLAQALAVANKNLSEAQKAAASAEAERNAADAALASAKAALDQATAARDLASKDKADKQMKRDQSAKQLNDAQTSHKKNMEQGQIWGKRTSFRSNQVSLLRETHRKAKEAHESVPDDAALKEAVNKQLEALAAMEKALEQASAKTAAYVAKTEEFAKLAATHVATLDAAEKALQATEAILVSREKTRTEKASVIEATKTEQETNLATHTKANALLEQRNKELSTAKEAEKGPAEMLRQAEASLATARNSVSKWKAEKINVNRHLELEKLHVSEGELKELDDIATQATDLHVQALAVLEQARKALAEVPAKIKGRETALSQSQANMQSENQQLEKVKQVAIEKQAFLREVEKIANATKTKAEGDDKNAELAAVTSKLKESLDLLKKDLANAQTGIANQMKKLESSQSAAKQAQAELEKARLLTETAPKLVSEKQDMSNQSQVKMAEAKKTRDTFKTTVEAQRAKAEEMLKQYLQALPK